MPLTTIKKPTNPLKSLPNPKKVQKLRIALYSHDTMGLGHKRRNLLIAQSLANSSLNADILVISGMSDMTKVGTHPNIEYLTLPALYKTGEGQYQARRLQMSLDDIIKLRSQVIRTTIKNFQPDVFIVDNVPRGAIGELDRTLKYLRNQGKTLCILGLRDILDQPEVIIPSWKKAKNEETIARFYDNVWLYGDEKVYNPIKEYQFSAEVATKIRYTGYLDQRCRLKYAKFERKQSINKKNKRLALCLVGGGQDGYQLARGFTQAQLPQDTNGVIITGPLMPSQLRQQLHHEAQNRPNLQILDYVSEPTLWLEKADFVVSMGGYNTTCEILSFEKWALIIPRIQPREEQLIRAQRLQALGLVDMLHPDYVTPEALSQWLCKEVAQPNVHEKIDFQGLKRIPQYLGELLTVADRRFLKVS
ncbi:glycosyltransferase family protein [Crocosphaera sp. Alani8]|uniref:glycosyltransferase family protein n=1 Tax=Crocosphaera sp. Alani8 TaxID=3038952 RepID=UPI00313D4884